MFTRAATPPLLQAHNKPTPKKSKMKQSITLLAAAALLLALLGACVADAHAVMLKPASRPWLDYMNNYNYNPHAVFAGGVKSTSDNGKLSYPAMRTNGFCGDAVGQTKWDTPGQVATTYKAGSTISVDVLFAQNHLGRMQLRLCPLSAKSTKECKTLKRPGGKGSAFDLPWTYGWAGATSGYDAPVNTDGFSTYKLPPIGKAEGCGTWACDQFKGMYVYRTQWQLPAGFTCEHCKLQMFYLTGSRCWPPCLKEPCSKPVPYKYCGQPGATYPEMFFNCADVKVA